MIIVLSILTYCIINLIILLIVANKECNGSIRQFMKEFVYVTFSDNETERDKYMDIYVSDPKARIAVNAYLIVLFIVSPLMIAYLILLIKSKLKK